MAPGRQGGSGPRDLTKRDGPADGTAERSRRRVVGERHRVHRDFHAGPLEQRGHRGCPELTDVAGPPSRRAPGLAGVRRYRLVQLHARALVAAPARSSKKNPAAPPTSSRRGRRQMAPWKVESAARLEASRACRCANHRRRSRLVAVEAVTERPRQEREVAGATAQQGDGERSCLERIWLRRPGSSRSRWGDGTVLPR